MAANPVRIEDGIVYLGIRGVGETLIDLEDITRVTSHIWHAIPSASGTLYVHNREAGYLHRFILGLEKGSALHGDHINRNTFDNRRCNLRAVTPGENNQNQNPSLKSSRTGVRGVSITSSGENTYYRATVTLDHAVVARKLFPYCRDGLQEAANWVAAERARLLPYDNGIVSRDMEAALAAAPQFAREPLKAIGSRHGMAKLNEEDVASIRRLASAGAKQADLAKDFGVGIATISDVVNRKLWAHVA